MYSIHRPTTPSSSALSPLPLSFKALLAQTQPEQVVIEACAISGWVHDLCKTQGFELIVANPNEGAWNWRHVKRKTDKDDALKLAKLAALEQIVPVYVPPAKSRQYRQLVKSRKRLVSRTTKVQNTIRATNIRRETLSPLSRFLESSGFLVQRTL